jgi:hypothetical protein
LNEAEVAYLLEPLQAKAYGSIPYSVRGLLYRRAPRPFLLARRLDEGGYVVLEEYRERPERKEIEDRLRDDSKQRDKSLSMAEKLKRLVPNFGS